MNSSKNKTAVYIKGEMTMKRAVTYITIFLMCIFALNINIAQAHRTEANNTSPVSLTPSMKDMSGYYEADDGGAYYIRQIGNNIYWFGEDPDGSYANVLKGTISGNQITARFWDVPKGKAKGSGEITLEIRGDALVKLSSSVPFGTKTLKKSFMRTEFVNGVPVITGLPPEARSRPAGFLGGENNLTAAWVGDDYAFYYVRELANGEVVWIAEHPFYGGQGGTAQSAFTHVFFGKKTGKVIKGEWIDVPKGKADGNGTLELDITGPQAMESTAKTGSLFASKWWRSLPNNLRGFADLHAHPMVHLGLSGKFVHGGTDIGSLLPADVNCNKKVRAKSIGQALGSDNPTHGGWGLDNPCGDDLREAVVDAFEEQNKSFKGPEKGVGYPSFRDWPRWNDLTHQKMWVDWIRRAYDGGQRVMVALAMNNQTLATGVAGPGDGPVDDRTSADLQIAEIKSFVKRHDDFMEVAYSSADLRRIVGSNKMAIILGLETDNIGNFDKFPVVTAALIGAELDRLYKQGVRYIFPIHLINNKFGGTAIYKNIFNLSNYHVNDKWWEIECGSLTDGIHHWFKKEGFDFPLAGAKALKLGIDIARNPPDPPQCPHGHKNKLGLTALGKAAIQEMMKRGMLIDVDHMSQYAVESTLKMAEGVTGGGYPLVSGHNDLRFVVQDAASENQRTKDQLKRIGDLGGMFGLGSDGADADEYLGNYIKASQVMGEGRVAFGTDLNGLVKGARPPFKVAGAEATARTKQIYTSVFLRSKTGDRSWNYTTDGVAHYGMLSDFLRDMSLMEPGGTYLKSHLMKNAEFFARMWEKAEKQSKGILP